jgi:hypothetical protein
VAAPVESSKILQAAVLNSPLYEDEREYVSFRVACYGLEDNYLLLAAEEAEQNKEQKKKEGLKELLGVNAWKALSEFFWFCWDKWKEEKGGDIWSTLKKYWDGPWKNHIVFLLKIAAIPAAALAIGALLYKFRKPLAKKFKKFMNKLRGKSPRDPQVEEATKEFMQSLDAQDFATMKKVGDINRRTAQVIVAKEAADKKSMYDRVFELISSAPSVYEGLKMLGKFMSKIKGGAKVVGGWLLKHSKTVISKVVVLFKNLPALMAKAAKAGMGLGDFLATAAIAFGPEILIAVAVIVVAVVICYFVWKYRKPLGAALAKFFDLLKRAGSHSKQYVIEFFNKLTKQDAQALSRASQDMRRSLRVAA